MYGYSRYIPLTKEEILDRVSQEDIFKIVIKEDIVLNKESLYRAPYRDDNRGDCYFEEYQGILYFIDYADTQGRHLKDCIMMIQRYYNLSYTSALQFISNHFNLEVGNGLKEESVRTVEEVFPDYVKKKITITYTPRLFEHKDKVFWSKYEISRANLIEDKVIPLTLYRSTSKRGKIFIIKPFDIMYGYTDFEDGKIKIYRPNSPSKEGKWFTNCNQNDLGCINSLPETGDLLIITKSYKDCRVLRNQGLNSIWVQSEGVMPSNDILIDLCNRFRRIVIWFDNDQTGLARAKAFKDHINGMFPNKAITIFLPPILLNEGIKDPSDYIASKGRQALLDFLILKQLL